MIWYFHFFCLHFTVDSYEAVDLDKFMHDLGDNRMSLKLNNEFWMIFSDLAYNHTHTLYIYIYKYN